MPTTALFVELVIIGVGAFTAVCLAVISLTGMPMPKVTDLNGLLFGFPLLAISYVSGIIIDRLADYLFSLVPQLHMHHSFSSNTAYHRAQRHIRFYANPNLSQSLEYTRSRLRICRGWSLNSLLLLLSANLWVWLANDHPFRSKVLASIVLSSMLLLLCIGCAYSFIDLNKKFHLQVLEKHAFLEEARRTQNVPARAEMDSKFDQPA